MALPARSHTFALETCRDVLGKLEWEIDGLEQEQDMPALAFRAFNCAVTAWHLSDWVWKALGGRRRAWGDDEENFKRDCRDKCPALAHCWLIANASKHGGIDIQKKKITTEVRSEQTRAFEAGSGRSGEALAAYAWKITVADRPQSGRNVIEIFREGMNYWTNLIYREQLG